MRSERGRVAAVFGITVASILFLGMPTTASCGTPNFDIDCSRILLETSASGPVVNRDWATEILAWITLSHPILTRAIERSQDENFLFDMAHYTTGFALPPEDTIDGRAMSRYLLSTKFESSLYFQNRGRESLARDVTVALEGGPNRAEYRRVVVRIVGRLRQLLADLSSDRHPSVTGSRGLRTYRFHDSLGDADGIEQDVRIRWGECFFEEEMKRIRQLAVAIENEDVTKEVVRALHAQLRPILLAQRALTKSIDRADAVSELQHGYQRWRASRDYVNVPFLASRSAPEIRLAPEPVSPVVAPSVPLPAPVVAPVPLPAPTPILPSPPMVSLDPVRAPAFDPRLIEDFIERASLELPLRLNRVPLREIYSNLNRVGLLVASGLGQLAKWRTPEPDWRAWEKTASASEAWSDRLNETLTDLLARRAKEFDQLIVAEEAFGKLDAWLLGLRDHVLKLEDLAGQSEGLSRRDQMTLRAVLDQIPNLLVLSRSAKLNVETRQTLIFEADHLANQLGYLLGDLQRRRLVSTGELNLEALHGALLNLAEATEAEVE